MRCVTIAKVDTRRLPTTRLVTCCACAHSTKPLEITRNNVHGICATRTRAANVHLTCPYSESEKDEMMTDDSEVAPAPLGWHGHRRSLTYRRVHTSTHEMRRSPNSEIEGGRSGQTLTTTDRVAAARTHSRRLIFGERRHGPQWVAAHSLVHICASLGYLAATRAANRKVCDGSVAGSRRHGFGLSLW